ncbi:unnamed protein product [Ixodes hexagonus]
MSGPSRRPTPGAHRHPNPTNKYVPRYDLRRRVLVTNLMRGQREGEVTSIVDQSPARPARRWGYSEDKRMLTFHPVLTRRRIKSPRKLGSPRSSTTATDTVEIQQRRLRRSGSYREAVSADSALPTVEVEELPTAKRARLEVPLKSPTVKDLSLLKDETHRVQHGRPFAARPCFKQTSAASGSCAMDVSMSKPHLPAVSTPVRRQPIAAPRRNVPISNPALGNVPTAASQVHAIVHSRQARLTQGTQPFVYRQQAPFSHLFQNAEPSVQLPNPHLVPASPQTVTQSTQTSPPTKSKGLLRRRSSLRRALERVLGVGKENEDAAKSLSGDSSSKDSSSRQSSRVKRRPSFVEAFLSRRRSCDTGGNNHDISKRPAPRRSAGLPGIFKSAEDCPKSMSGTIVKVRRARSLRVQSSTTFDPWG